MLILADTDRLWSDLNQFCQWILQTSRDGRCASLSNIKIRKFFCCQLTCGIDGSTRLIGDHILYFLRNLFQQLHNDLFRFSGCSSISKRDQRNIVFFDQFPECFFCSTNLCIICWRCRINYGCIQYLSCLIYNSQFTAGTESRVPSKDNFANDWRLHQKLLQVLSEHMDCTVLGFFCQITSDFSLNSRSDQTFVAVFYHFTKNR